MVQMKTRIVSLWWTSSSNNVNDEELIELTNRKKTKQEALMKPSLYFCFDLLPPRVRRQWSSENADRCNLATATPMLSVQGLKPTPCETRSKRCFNIKTFTIGEAAHPLSGWISGGKRLFYLSGNGPCANMK